MNKLPNTFFWLILLSLSLTSCFDQGDRGSTGASTSTGNGEGKFEPESDEVASIVLNSEGSDSLNSTGSFILSAISIKKADGSKEVFPQNNTEVATYFNGSTNIALINAIPKLAFNHCSEVNYHVTSNKSSEPNSFELINNYGVFSTNENGEFRSNCPSLSASNEGNVDFQKESADFMDVKSLKDLQRLLHIRRATL